MTAPETMIERRGGLLLVESDDAIRRTLQLLLEGRGYEVLAFASVRMALADARAAARPGWRRVSLP